MILYGEKFENQHQEKLRKRKGKHHSYDFEAYDLMKLYFQTSHSESS